MANAGNDRHSVVSRKSVDLGLVMRLARTKARRSAGAVSCFGPNGFGPTEIPQGGLIRQLSKPDAFCEALWALDRPPAARDLKFMLRDTPAALDQVSRSLTLE